MSELSRYVGEIVKFPKPLNVQGLLRCDGSSYSEDEYPELFDVIGRLYGGTGSEFQVPLIPPSAFDASLLRLEMGDHSRLGLSGHPQA